MDADSLIKILIASQAGLLSMFVFHLFRCRDTRVDIAAIRGSIERIQKDIGDHEHGMRGQLHQQAQTLTRHEMDIAVFRIKSGQDPR